MLLDGHMPEIDPRFKTRSKEEEKLAAIIEKCFELYPKDRPSIFDVVKFLQKAVDDNLPPGQTTAQVLQSIDSSDWDWIEDDDQASRKDDKEE